MVIHMGLLIIDIRSRSVADGPVRVHKARTKKRYDTLVKVVSVHPKLMNGNGFIIVLCGERIDH